jgi:hypothetical protein
LLKHFWSTTYLTELTAGADRHGPEGIQGTVTEEAANRAVEQLKTLKTQAVEKSQGQARIRTGGAGQTSRGQEDEGGKGRQKGREGEASRSQEEKQGKGS